VSARLIASNPSPVWNVSYPLLSRISFRSLTVGLVVLDDEDAFRVIAHRQVLDNMRVRLTTRKKEVFRHECSETNEFHLFVTDTVRHVAFVEKISKIQYMSSKLIVKLPHCCGPSPTCPDPHWP
jgi:hypothetical protein